MRYKIKQQHWSHLRISDVYKFTSDKTSHEHKNIFVIQRYNFPDNFTTVHLIIYMCK